MLGGGWPIWSGVNIGSRLGVRPHADSHNDFARFSGMLIDGLQIGYVNGFGYNLFPRSWRATRFATTSLRSSKGHALEIRREVQKMASIDIEKGLAAHRPCA